MHPRIFDGPDFICDHQKAVGIVAMHNFTFKPFKSRREIMAICMECQTFQILMFADFPYVQKFQCPDFFVVRNI